MGRRRIHGEHTRRALLAAAEALVARHGVSALSVRSVADAVGTSTRAVYSVFGSKEALLRGLAVHALELLMEAIDAIPLTTDPIADLQAGIFLGFRPFALKHPDLFRLGFLWPPVRPEASVMEANLSAFNQLTLRIERAQAAGLLPHRAPVELALELAAVANGLAASELYGMPPGVADRVWKDTIGDVLRGLGTRAHHEQRKVV